MAAFAISAKGDNFCDFRFAFLHTKSLLKKDLLQKERFCSEGGDILSFKSRAPFRKKAKPCERLASLEGLSIPLNEKFTLVV